MRYSKGHKPETRQKIVEAAARAFRRHGPNGISVSEIMANAGLTVGGFYRHFESKDELFQEALKRSMGETIALLQRSGRGSESQGLAWLRRAAAAYLTPEHRDLPEKGCPLPAVTAEVSRRGADVRRSFGDSLEALVDEIAGRLDPERPDRAREQAWGFLSTLVGSLLLARGVGDEDLAAEILAAGKAAAVFPGSPIGAIPTARPTP